MPERDWIERLNKLASVETSSLDQAVTKLVLLPIAALFFGAADTIASIFNFIVQPLTAAGDSIAAFVSAVIGGAGEVVGAGADASKVGVEPFGILGFVVALGVVLAGAYVLGWYLDREETSDTIPFTNTDLPIIGSDEDEG